MAGATFGTWNAYLHSHIADMQDIERFSETVSERKERLEAAITEALQREAERHEAAVKNMHRLRALRLERGQNKPVVERENAGLPRPFAGTNRGARTAPNGPSPINEPPPPIDDPPKPPQPDEPPKPPPVNDPLPEEKPPPMRAASGTARQRSRSRDL
jgi:hypothetical protein